MTEDEWLPCADPERMLRHVRAKASNRKLRLFACACYRHVPSLLGLEHVAEALTVSERYADGLATREELCQALNPCGGHGGLWDGWNPAVPTPERAERVRARTAHAAGDNLAERGHQATLLRCIFGNLFRRVPSLPPAVLAWNERTVLKLAAAIYDERAFDRLPVLADGLEDAGCTDAAILGHCRGPGPHARGCWVVDLLLGKSRGGSSHSGCHAFAARNALQGR